MGVVRHQVSSLRGHHGDIEVFPYPGRHVDSRITQTGGSPRRLEPRQLDIPYYSPHDHLFGSGEFLTSPIAHSSGAVSPGAVSWASGNSNTNESGSFSHLARRRGLSVAFYTPTGSTTSSQEVPFTTSAYHSPQEGFAHLQPSLSPPLSLLGLNENSYNHSPFPHHNVEYQNYHTVPSPPPKQLRAGVRWRPLSPDARENASLVRESGGSCIRCFIMKEKCDTSSPCGRCVQILANARSWKLACSRKWLDERGTYLVPDVLANQLDFNIVDAFVNTKSFFPLDNSSLSVVLTIGFGNYLVLDAVEVDPLGPALISMHGFHGPSSFNMGSPPIVPRWPVKVDAILMQVRSWIQGMLSSRSILNWPDECFEEDGPQWRKQVLELICQHYLAVTEDADQEALAILNTALQLSISVYVMGHALTVPDEHINRLYEQLRNPEFKTPPTGGYVCPRAVNKVVKAVVFRLVKHLTEKVVEQLHCQLGPKADKNAPFDQAFSSSFLCLASLGEIQTSVLERAIAGNLKDDYSFTLDNAREEISSMERELGSYVVELFLNKYKTKRRNSGRSPASSSPPATNTLQQGESSRVSFKERLQMILQGSKVEIRADCRELGLIDEKTFSTTNVTRILARLCSPLIEE